LEMNIAPLLLLSNPIPISYPILDTLVKSQNLDNTVKSSKYKARKT